MKYLNGNLIPYFDIGDQDDLDISWKASDADYGSLVITGSKSWDDDTSTTVQTAYTREEYEISTSSSLVVTANDKTGKIHVMVAKKSTFDSTIVITVTMDEDYDKTSSSAWDADTLQAISDKIGVEVPYVYLGTRNPYANVISYNSYKLSIYGGKWNAQVLSDAKETLVGYELVEGAESITATKAVGNDTLTIQVKSYEGNDTTSVKKIVMVITLSEAFEPESSTEWSQDTKDAFVDYLHGHELPYFYLGTKKPDISYSKDCVMEVRGHGAITDDNYATVISAAKSAFHDASWTVVKESNYSLTYSMKYDDDCFNYVTISKNSTYGAYISCRFAKPLTAPSADSGWKEETKTLMQEKLGLELPYVYLNTDEETTDWKDNDDGSYTLTILGGSWDNGIPFEAEKTYSAIKDSNNASVWSVEWDDYTRGYAVEFTAKIDGNSYDIIIQSYNKTTARMQLTYIPKYEAADWDSTTKGYMYANMDNHVIPYVYLNKKVTPSSYSSSSNTLTIKGGVFDADILTAAKTVYVTDNGWTVSGENSTKLIVEKTYADGCKQKVTFAKNGSSIKVTVVYTPKTSE